jgi:hypothetical protein
MGFPELGNVSLEELENIQHPSLPIPLIVLDGHFETEYMMSVYVEAVCQHQKLRKIPIVCRKFFNK